MRRFLAYYWQWLRLAVAGAYGWAMAIGASISVFGPPAARRFMNIEWQPNPIIWQIVGGLTLALIAIRLVLAPFWMHRESEKKRKAAECVVKRYRERENKAKVLGDVLDEAVVTWLARVDRVKDDEEREAWRQEYILWFEKARERVSGAVGEPEMRATLTIGNTDKLLENLIATYGSEEAIPRYLRHRKFLSHHIEELKSAIIRLSSQPPS